MAANAIPTKETTRRRAGLYRKAARLVENGNPFDAEYGFACNAIEVVKRRDPFDGRSPTKETMAFREVFSPGWETGEGFFGPMAVPANRSYRVIALCFMAAMVEAGDA